MQYNLSPEVAITRTMAKYFTKKDISEPLAIFLNKLDCEDCFQRTGLPAISKILIRCFCSLMARILHKEFRDAT